jgi:ATP-dependent DNA ligase
MSYDGEDLTSTPYRARHDLVRKIKQQFFANFDSIIIPEPQPHGKLLYFKQVLKNKENEGIVMKHVNGKYLASTKKGLHNAYWIKVKER